ncbi:MAG: SurA N-terminal domain-containing protein [Coriobacteriia bacterium]
MKSARLIFALVAALILIVAALLMASCRRSGSSDIAARVNGQAISEADLDSELDLLKKQSPDLFSGDDAEETTLQYKVKLLDGMINDLLVAKAAEERGLSVTSKEIDQEVAVIKSGFSDQDQFDAALKSAGYTLPVLKEKIRTQLIRKKLADSLAPGENVSEVEIQDYYEKHQAEYYQYAAKRASRIFFKPEDKALAEEVLKQLQGGSDFATLAKQYSADTVTAPGGGDLGWPETPYTEEFQEALDKLAPGEMSGLVESPYGWDIILCTDERPAGQLPLSAVRAKIERTILAERRTEAYENFVKQLRADATIEIIDAELKAPFAKAHSEETTSSQEATSSSQ